MKTEKNIFIAFLLNLLFAFIEMIGGALTGSVAIISDAVHDIGDAVSIGVSWFLEKKSKKQADNIYTYGYVRYSAVGSVITTVILLVGSVLVIANAIERIGNPVPIHYNGMILFAVIGALLNLAAAWLTRNGDSLNQKAVNLHMLEDVLGWIVVLIGAVVMRFTDISLLDPLMSIGVALFIFFHAAKNLKEVLDLFLEKLPEGLDIEEIRSHISEIEGVQDVHHIHIRSIDGFRHCATMHIVTDADGHTIKEAVRRELAEFGIWHATLELESGAEICCNPHCSPSPLPHGHHHGHSHHHHKRH